MANRRWIPNNSGGGYFVDDDWQQATQDWFGKQMLTGRIPSLEEGNAIDALVVAITISGANGKNAYEVAVDNGFAGDVIAWLASLVGPVGADATPPNFTVQTGLPGSQVVISGTYPNLTITIPEGQPGTNATLPNFTVQTGNPGTPVSISGVYPNLVITIPRGADGSTPALPNFTVATGGAGSNVQITGVYPNLTITIPQGLKGDTGNGITTVTRTTGTGAPGTSDTYTITFSNGSTSTFTVYNGANGAAGNGIASIVRTSGTGAAGTTDTYTITFTNSSTFTFTVYNGANGNTWVLYQTTGQNTDGPMTQKAATDAINTVAATANAAATRFADQKTISASYTILASDCGKQLVYNGTSNILITVPSGITTGAGANGAGFICGLLCTGTGQATVVQGSGVTLDNEDLRYTTKRKRPATVEGIGSNAFLTFNTPNT